ncbi:hypothetical protein [Arthrobacter sp. UYEF20]|uniref:hypothetical protein n=1 Tax=Arthrobacter sp. UYEF20 TaxID=1756363 RepID=UPI00339A4BB8
MSSTEPLPELIPEPSALVALVTQLVEGRWSRSDEERQGLFKRLGFTSGARLDEAREGSTGETFALATELPGEVFTSWSSYNGRFMGICFRPYAFMEPGVPAALRGHDEVWNRLTDLYGQPTRPWDNEEVPPSIWKVNGRDIVPHFSDRRDSGMMLSIEDTELSAAAEAEAHNEWLGRRGGSADPA